MWRALLGLSVLAGCSSGAGGDAAPQPSDRETITFEAGPCYGPCPVFRITVGSDGFGWFEGQENTAVEGGRPFRVTPAQYQAFAARLAAHRPRGTEVIDQGHARCQMYATDHWTATVSWVRGQALDRLSFYFGCRDPANAALAEALGTILNLLPARDFISARR